MLKGIFLLSVLFFFIVQFSYSQICRENRIYFKSNKFSLNADNKFILDSLISSLNADSIYLMEIQGHTDKIGSEKKNLLLGRKRMESVVNYIYSKKLNNIVVIYNNYGESKPTSKELKINRRATIFILPINADKTLSIKGGASPAVDIKVPAIYFNNCGVCDSFPVLKSKVNTSDGNLTGGFEVAIDAPCEWDRKCLAAEFRFQKNYFEESDKINVPRPIYVKGCGKIRDSVDAKTFENFEIQFDTLTNEYVITHDCYNPDWTICCGFRYHCNSFKYKLPSELTNLSSSYIITFPKFTKAGNELKDSLFTIKDTNYFELPNCKNIKDKLWGMAFLNGDLRFLECDAKLLPYNIHTDEKGFYLFHEVVVPLELFKPLTYSDTKLLIKLPRKLKILRTGFYIKQFDYFIPIENRKRNKFQNDLLEYDFQIAFETAEQTERLNYSDLKSKYKKRKNIIIIRIRKQDLKKRN